ncbi:HTH-type transcriptional regulator CueR [Lachnospiraceae bacterium]|nr:HTH-type transcriptional regulator CueR [Lachnospiraceae bacterium]
MLSIGEFSRICEVTPKTLRYYEEIGLLYPEEISLENGYRYYSIKQLEKMLLINRLKSYKLSLEEIKVITGAMGVSSDNQILSALIRQKGLLLNQIEKISDIIRQIDFDIQQIKVGKSIMSYLLDIDVKLVEYPQQNILYLRRKLTHEECLNGYSQFFCKLYQKIATEKLTVMGPAITIYHNPSCDLFEFEIEFAVPIKEVVTGTRDFQNGLCVKSTLNGSYANITSIYARQQEWAESNGYDFIRSPFELYITEPNATNTPDDYITEIYYPVIKRR